MPKTLLLADDSVTIQKVVGISFANEDVALLTVDNGDDAIARARETQPDIVLADVVMPGMNGYEVCEAIKSDPQLCNTPVLLLTGTFEAFDEERATRAGADGHITKPFEAQALVDQVNARLAQTAAPAAEPTPLQQTPALEDSLGLGSAPDTNSQGGASFDFFDEEITEPGTTPSPASSAETMIVSDGLEVDGEGEDAFAFEASDDFDEELSTSSPGAEVDAAAEMLEPLAEPEMAADSTVAILPDDEAFASTLAEPPATPPTLGESDLAEFEPEELSVIPAAETPFVDFTSSVPEEPAPTRIIPETAALDVSPDPLSEEISAAPDETVLLSDLDSDPLGDPFAADAIDIVEAAPPEDHTTDPLAEAETDDLAVEAVLNPAGGRDFDVSSSDLGDALFGPAATPEPAEQGASSPWMAEPPVLEEAELLSEPASEEAPDPAPELLVTPTEDPPSATSAPDLSPLTREQLHDALEKIAWEAFSDVTERIVSEALERIERVAWEVIPQMAEALIREEIQKLKGEDD
jgi:CheY-like chemotaxis protein